MRVVAITMVFVALAGCGGKKRQKRTGDAAPVEVIAAPTGSDGGIGQTTDESEPNDSSDLATPLELGASVRGTLDPETDADYYRIVVAQAGALAVSTSGVDADLSLELEDAAGAVIARSDRGAARVREGVPNFSVTPGRYTAVVRRKVAAPPKKAKRGKKAATPAPVAPVSYDITAQVAPFAPNAEREPDEDRGTANDLIIGDTGTGFVGWTGDADVWKLSVEAVSANNTIEIEVGAIEGVAHMIELADGVGTSLLARKGARGAALAVRGVVPVVPAGAPPFHYLTIKGDRSNPETPYQLRVIQKAPEPDNEIEPNDTAETAMEIPVDRTRVNVSWSAGDLDFFAVPPAPSPRTIDVSVATPPEVDLSVDLLVDGAVIATSALKGKGTAEKVSGQVPAGVRAVIKVRGTEVAGEATYELAIHEGPAIGP